MGSHQRDESEALRVSENRRHKKTARWRLMAPCYCRCPYGKTTDGTMAKTNIERFDEMSADILAFLYDGFPIPSDVSPEVAGLTTVKYLDHDPVTEVSTTIGEHDPETEFFNSTLEWLVQSGFISKRSAPVNRQVYVLTPSGLQSLKHVPKPSLGAETLGEKLSAATKAGTKHAASEILNQALSIGAQLIIRGAGL
jgi:hypothetical protein